MIHNDFCNILTACRRSVISCGLKLLEANGQRHDEKKLHQTNAINVVFGSISISSGTMVISICEPRFMSICMGI